MQGTDDRRQKIQAEQKETNLKNLTLSHEKKRKRAEDGQQMRSEKHVSIGKLYTGVSVSARSQLCIVTRSESNSY